LTRRRHLAERGALRFDREGGRQVLTRQPAQTSRVATIGACKPKTSDNAVVPKPRAHVRFLRGHLARIHRILRQLPQWRLEDGQP
jgi:hypothetical protein